MAAIMEVTMGVIMEEDIMEVDITVDITDYSFYTLLIFNSTADESKPFVHFHDEILKSSSLLQTHEHSIIIKF